MEDLELLHMTLRGLITRGVVTAVDDSGGDQVVTVKTHWGRVRARVPVLQSFGDGGNAPLDGATVLVLAVGGDQSDLIALPAHNSNVARMGNVPAGDKVIYDATGQKIWLSAGKVVQVDAFSELRVRVGGTTVLDVTQDGVTVTGELKVSKGITAGADIVAGTVSLQKHTHPVSGSETEEPNS